MLRKRNSKSGMYKIKEMNVRIDQSQIRRLCPPIHHHPLIINPHPIISFFFSPPLHIKSVNSFAVISFDLRRHRRALPICRQSASTTPKTSHYSSLNNKQTNT